MTEIPLLHRESVIYVTEIVSNGAPTSTKKGISNHAAIAFAPYNLIASKEDCFCGDFDISIFLDIFNLTNFLSFFFSFFFFFFFFGKNRKKI